MAHAIKPELLECTECGAVGKLKGLIHKRGCTCPGTYGSPGERAAAAVKAHPEKSDRAIADDIGVGSNTVKRARETTAPDGAVDKRVGKDGKSRRLPKPHKNSPEREEQAARLVLDEGKTHAQAATETGVGSRQIIKTAVAFEAGKRAAEAQIDPATLSVTAREKFDAAIRQHKHKLDMEFEQRVRAECQSRIEQVILPEYTKEIEDARAVLKARKGVMPRAAFKKILACLHPDRVDASLAKRYAEAFSIFSGLERVLCSEAELPTSTSSFPRSYAEMMARKQTMDAARRRKSTNGSAPTHRG